MINAHSFVAHAADSNNAELFEAITFAAANDAESMGHIDRVGCAAARIVLGMRCGATYIVIDAAERALLGDAVAVQRCEGNDGRFVVLGLYNADGNCINAHGHVIARRDRRAALANKRAPLV